jgi:hypothetical protein
LKSEEGVNPEGRIDLKAQDQVDLKWKATLILDYMNNGKDFPFLPKTLP